MEYLHPNSFHNSKIILNHELHYTKFERNNVEKRKKYVDRDYSTVSSSILQSFFFWGTMLLDFGFLTEEASWI